MVTCIIGPQRCTGQAVARLIPAECRVYVRTAGMFLVMRSGHNWLITWRRSLPIWQVAMSTIWPRLWRRLWGGAFHSKWMHREIIPPQIMPQVFRPFLQVDTTAATTISANRPTFGALQRLILAEHIAAIFTVVVLSWTGAPTMRTTDYRSVAFEIRADRKSAQRQSGLKGITHLGEVPRTQCGVNCAWRCIACHAAISKVKWTIM